MSDAFELVKTVLAETYKIDPTSLTEETVAADVDGWDSVSHTTLILRLEDAFKRELPFDAMYGAENLGALVRAIEELA